MRPTAGFLFAAFSIIAAPATHAGVLGPPRSVGGQVAPAAARGNIAYLPNGSALDIWNYGDAARPVRTRADLTAELDGHILSAAVAGRALCIVRDNGVRRGVSIYALDDPAHPALASALDVDDPVRVATQGTTLFVFGLDGNLDLYDVTDPAAPLALSSVYATPLGVTDMRVASERVYAITRLQWRDDSAMTIYDTHDPTRPTLLADAVDIGNVGLIGDPTDDGFVPAASADSFLMLDTSDPSAIIRVFESGSPDYAFDAVRRNASVYLGGVGSIETWDVSQPAAPLRVGDSVIPDSTEATDLLLLDDGLLAITHANKGYFYDISASLPDNAISTIDTPTADVSAFRSVRDDNHVYTLDFGAFEVRDIETLAVVGSIGGGVDPSSGGRLDVVGHTVFVPSAYGLRAIDVADPSAPHVVGAVLQGTYVTGVASGPRAYLHDADAHRLVAVDISDPSAMQVGGALAGDFEVYAASGTRAFTMNPYLADPDDPLMLRIVDAAAVSAPRVIGSYPVCPGSGTIISLAASDDGTKIAILCDNDDDGIEILDVGDPAAPTILTTIPGYSNAGQLGWRGPWLYVGAHSGADDSNGIDILDVSQPSAVRLVTHFDVPDSVQSGGIARTLSFSPDGGLLALTSKLGIVVADCAIGEGPPDCGSRSESGRRNGHSHHASRPAIHAMSIEPARENP